VSLPHLGASTEEAEENCAVMVAEQVADYLENGNILNAVNFPNVVLPRESSLPPGHRQRQRAEHAGPDLHHPGRGRLNIHNMVNKSKGDMAFTLVDVDSACHRWRCSTSSRAIEGVLNACVTCRGMSERH
jgi:D-3-phosphoglycerate dehydrogenase